MNGLPNEILKDRDVFVHKLADGFGSKLRDWLTEGEMRQVVDRNAVETDRDVCHSHDFCDANMAMLGALEEVAPEWDFDGNDVDQAAIWNDAWSAAKSTRFEPSASPAPAI